MAVTLLLYAPTIATTFSWLIRRSASVAPVLLVLFSPSVWAAAHGFTVTRSRAEFEWNGVPFWNYVVPTGWHGLGRHLPAGMRPGPGAVGANSYESASYLGVVPMALMARTAIG